MSQTTPGSDESNTNGRFLLDSMISLNFARLSTRLFAAAHISMLFIFMDRESTLLAGTIRYVSWANLTRWFSGVTTLKLLALTTYNTGLPVQCLSSVWYWHWWTSVSTFDHDRLCCASDPWRSQLASCRLRLECPVGPTSSAGCSDPPCQTPYWNRVIWQWHMDF